ncbi:hypothetical protein [Conexibacter arvalis]|uniref:DUF2867 domain-containing protein n=1 Tax=Conexibacter arvalis TaxID=912552 RepID=A0A840IIL3_9ACTN|nr:hypothetical protein [Conexibacter arvalis]MBB4664175.1 hypothetical protein [Conexibacter arvalis]
MERLPYIDEHARIVGGSREQVWRALVDTVRRETAGGEPLARLLGCEQTAGSRPFEGEPGQTIPGFRVAEAEPGRRLALRGRHRFADYQLTFLLDDDGRLRALTHADFPGLRGRVYKALVIGTRGHVVATRHLLRAVGRRVAAQRPG